MPTTRSRYYVLSEEDKRNTLIALLSCKCLLHKYLRFCTQLPAWEDSPDIFPTGGDDREKLASLIPLIGQEGVRRHDPTLGCKTAIVEASQCDVYTCTRANFPKWPQRSHRRSQQPRSANRRSDVRRRANEAQGTGGHTCRCPSLLRHALAFEASRPTGISCRASCDAGIAGRSLRGVVSIP